MIKLRRLLLHNYPYIILCLFSFIIALVITLLIKYKTKYDINTKTFSCTIEDIKYDGDKLSLELYGKEKLKGSLYFKTLKEKNDFLNTYNLGDTIEIKGELLRPKNNTIPGQFNYKKYLYNKKIYYNLNINSYKLLKTNKNILYKLKNTIRKRIETLDNKEYFYTFILGTTYFVDNNVSSSYRTNGISHLFALSGLHVTVFSTILIKLLSLIKVKETKRYIIVSIFLLLLCFITSFSASICRASLLFFLLSLNKIFYTQISSVNILLLTFSIIILINPFYIYEVGFQYSFLISFFLMLSSDLINNKSKIKSLLSVSIISFISSLPITIYNFFSINILGIIFNLFFVPFVSNIVFPFSLLTFIFPPLSKILNILLNIMENISLLCSRFSIGTISFPKMDVLLIYLFYIILFIIIVKKNKKSIILLTLLLFITYIKPYLNNDYNLYFLDVNQGDSFLLTTPHLKKSIVIDTGGKLEYKKEEWAKTNKHYDLGTNTLIPFYKSIGVKKIDYLFLTHGDEDHCGEARNIINNFNVDKIYINKGQINHIERELKASVINFKRKTIDNVQLEILNTKIFNEENDDSIVLSLKILNNYIYMTGDSSIKTEQSIMSLKKLYKSLILKCGHHGSKTSSSDEFIKKLRPKYSIISVGEKNRYSHPSKEVINTLNKYNSNILKTSTEGTINFKINKKRVTKVIYKPY